MQRQDRQLKTLDKAKELLAEDGTVYLLSTLTIDGTDTLENMTIRPASNLSTLVKVAQKGHLTVKNVKLRVKMKQVQSAK